MDDLTLLIPAKQESESLPKVLDESLPKMTGPSIPKQLPKL